MNTQIPLSEITAGETAQIQIFTGGATTTGRLVSLGFTPGVWLTMVQNYGRGPLIVCVRGSRIALGRGEAAKIMVERGIYE